jgi:hypothetical protein
MDFVAVMMIMISSIITTIVVIFVIVVILVVVIGLQCDSGSHWHENSLTMDDIVPLVSTHDGAERTIDS